MWLALILSLTLQYSHAFLEADAVETERERLNGYAEFKEDQRIINREREKGETAFLEEQEKWARTQEKARKEFAADLSRKEKARSMVPYHEWRDDKVAEMRDRAQKEEKFHADRKKNRREFKRPISEPKELEIYANRPRYEFRKRVLYGAAPSFKGMGTGFGGGAAGGYQAPSSGGNAGAPPPMEDFGDPSFTPPPVMPDVGTDPAMDFPNSAEIPPPPPPPFPEGDFPPPPPPPPGFEDGDVF
ncbi:MAG: hypothetical protein V4736_10340 [Bdellovibrionota bacterium]